MSQLTTSLLKPITAAVIYHSGCLDGLMAATNMYAWLSDSAVYYKMNYKKSDAEYQEMVNTFLTSLDKDQQLNVSDLKNLDLYIVDFSLPPSFIEALAEQFKSVVVMDHHTGAIAKFNDWFKVDLSGPISHKLGNVELIFYTELSGAELAYQYIKEKPETRGIFRKPLMDKLGGFSLYVGDRDRWKFLYGDITREVCSALYLHVNDTPDQFFDLLNSTNELEVRAKGYHYNQYRDHVIDTMLYPYKQKSDGTYDVYPDVDYFGRRYFMCKNVPLPFLSEYCHALLELRNDVSYVVIVHEQMTKHGYKVDFRGRLGSDDPYSFVRRQTNDINVIVNLNGEISLASGECNINIGPMIPATDADSQFIDLMSKSPPLGCNLTGEINTKSQNKNGVYVQSLTYGTKPGPYYTLYLKDKVFVSDKFDVNVPVVINKETIYSNEADVSEMAEYFNGSGHPGSAGCYVTNLNSFYEALSFGNGMKGIEVDTLPRQAFDWGANYAKAKKPLGNLYHSIPEELFNYEDYVMKGYESVSAT